MFGVVWVGCHEGVVRCGCDVGGCRIKVTLPMWSLGRLPCIALDHFSLLPHFLPSLLPHFLPSLLTHFMPSLLTHVLPSLLTHFMSSLLTQFLASLLTHFPPNLMTHFPPFFYSLPAYSSDSLSAFN